MNASKGFFDLPNLKKQINEHNAIISIDVFWKNQLLAQNIINKTNILKQKIYKFSTIENKIKDLIILLELWLCAVESEKNQLEDEIDSEIIDTNKIINNFEIELLLNGPYDTKDCIFSIQAGAGGKDAQNWAELLLRMYQRWFEIRGWKHEIIDFSAGESGGLKHITLSVKGENAYGFCKAERGVHRVVRISPFDSNKKRHTSFSGIDVITELDDVTLKDIVINENELKRDTFRSGGRGGQNVNKVETAIRLTHIPTGLVVVSQQERSQSQNEEIALKTLKNKLYALKLDQEKLEFEKFYGENNNISWGNQIRNYIFNPNRIVKDLRTKIETNDIESVMNGNLDMFVNAWLKLECSTKK